MPGIDPSILAAIGGGPPSGPPPGAAGPAAGPQQDATQAEPVALHDACQEACALVQQARAALEDLSSQVQMADEVDPKTEKIIGDAAAMIAKIDDSLAQAEQSMGAARQAHESMVSGDGDDKGPPPAPPKPGY